MAQGTITRRMNAVLNRLEDEFADLYTMDDFRSQIARLYRIYRSGNRSLRHEVLRELYAMFRSYGVDFEEDREPEYYEALAESEICRFLERSGVENRIMQALYARFQQFPSPADFILRIVNHLEKDPWKTDPLRLRILKQFILYGDYLNDVCRYRVNKNTGKSTRIQEIRGKAEIERYVAELPAFREKYPDKKTPDKAAVIELLDDGVFGLLENASADDKKLDGKLGLLKIAEDLSAGKFRSEGSTKKTLYYFAIVYGMTYAAPASEEDENGAIDFDPLGDVETALFRDYYANSLLSFLLDYTGNPYKEVELDPSGETIGYKNFAEMILLYYIAKKDLSPTEKLRRAYEMINLVKNEQFGEPYAGPEAAHAPDDSLTRVLRDAFTEELLNLPENGFKEYILRNYDCNTLKGAENGKQGTRLGALQVAQTRETAFQCCLDICRRLRLTKERLGEIAAHDGDYTAVAPLKLPEELPCGESTESDTDELTRCTYGLWLSPDLSALDPRGAHGRTRESFLATLKLANNLFLPEDLSSVKGMCLTVSSPEKITRMKLLAAYYYLFNTLQDYYGAVSSECSLASVSFRDVYAAFAAGADRYLTLAGFQPLSSKNIFDLFTVLSVYAYLKD